MSACLACGGADLVPFLSLGTQAFANAFHDGTPHDESRAPLAVVHCPTCDHSQLTDMAQPADLFSHYAYQSGISSRDYFAGFAARVVSEWAQPPSVLELACNDGSLMVEFARRGCHVLGVDPAHNLVTSASHGLPVVCGFWPAVAPQVRTDWQAVVALNVLAHTPDPLAFLRACARAVSDDGAIYIQTSQAQWVERGEIDCVYHEHVSYFTPRSMAALATRAGLVLTESVLVPVHGGSWLFTFGRSGEAVTLGPTTSPVLYGRMQERADRAAERLRALIAHETAAGRAVVGFGACAKGNVLLQYAGATLEYIVDETPTKVGKYAPGTGIPIVAPVRLASDFRPLTVIVLAWNWFDEIAAKIRTLAPGATIARVMGESDDD